MGFHQSGTAACKACCTESPFTIMAADKKVMRSSGFTCNWAEASCMVQFPDYQYGAKFDIMYDWEGYPQCALYNGKGGPDDHMGIAATPFMMQVNTTMPVLNDKPAEEFFNMFLQRG